MVSKNNYQIFLVFLPQTNLFFYDLCILILSSHLKKKVWELIKESVPLNQSFGDAYISDKHYNFFVNKGEATFDDMNNLINYVAEKVFKKTGIKLEKEIKILE